MKRKFLYHATSFNNVADILDKGIKVGVDGFVYLAETKENAFSFASLKFMGEKIVVFEVEIDREDAKYLSESFDHNFNFFKCRAWSLSKNIDADKITNCWVFNR